MYLDTHCHLQYTFAEDKISNFIDSLDNIAYLLDISTNITEFLNILKKELPSKVLYAVGLYPENAEIFNKSLACDLENIVKNNPVDAIGEVGLDYHWDYGTKLMQERLFRHQIELAIDRKLPLVIHSRDAFEDTYRILKSYNFNIPVILHCFGYGKEEAANFLEQGFFISFAGNLTYKNALNLHEAAKNVPLSKILLETDSPYLTPVPMRGKKNNPLNVKFTYEYLAKLKEIELSKLRNSIETNFKKIFNIK